MDQLHSDYRPQMMMTDTIINSQTEIQHFLHEQLNLYLLVLTQN